jgi:hypothetical protein
MLSLFCVRICVRKTFQNLLKLEKIGKSVKNHNEQIQLLKQIEEVRKLGGSY